ncbi:MAG: hypothetical protein LBU07_04770 [Coriobacteriales bacterium]|nr:hypothetical protein [Coriobacteriales bacterium]
MDSNGTDKVVDQLEVGVSETIDNAAYHPLNAANSLAKLLEDMPLIYSSFPRLDGSERLYPVYGAFVEGILGLSEGKSTQSR